VKLRPCYPLDHSPQPNRLGIDAGARSFGEDGQISANLIAHLRCGVALLTEDWPLRREHALGLVQRG